MLGEHIRKLRHQKGLSQEALAEGAVYTGIFWVISREAKKA